jgi:tetrahydromethanopterin S-methyltransferase subunit F
LQSNNETYWQSFIGNVNDPSYVAKVDSNSNVKGTTKLPSNIGMGIQYRSGDYWQIGLDVIRSSWSTFTRYNKADSTGDYMSIRLGAAITPDVNSVTNYWKKMTYRAGIYTGQDIFQFGNQAIRANGLTVGIGYPVRRTNLSIGQINASFDVGQRGTTANGLLSERYTKFSVGFTFNDKWFIKRRYD